MTNRAWTAGIGLLLLIGIAPPIALADGCPLFVLKRAGDDIAIERRQIEQGQTQVFIADADTGIIDVIVPPGPGGSAGLLQLSQPRTIIVRCTEDDIRVTSRTADGKEYARPPQRLDDLRGMDVRISVTAAEGRNKAFIIEGYDTVRVDADAPVVDLFGGKIPLGEGDFAVTTQTTRRTRDAATLTGEFPFEYLRVRDSGYLLANVPLPGGETARFVVDLAAGQSVISRKVLPEGVTVEEGTMLEHSADGTRQLSYAVGGATGEVGNVVGLATLPTLTVGSMSLNNVNVMVMEKLFELGGVPIDGIIGMNVLRRARVVTFEYPPAGETTGRVIFSHGPETPKADKCVRLPMTSVGRLAFVRGNVGGTSVSFILDTGASCNLLAPESAGELHVPIDRDKSRTIRGLDGKGAEVAVATIPVLELGGREFRDVPFEVGELAALGHLKTGQAVGILGNTFLQQFRSVEIDFRTEQIRLGDR